MLDKHLIRIEEELEEKYKEKKQDFVRLTEMYKEDENLLSKALDLISRSEKQTRALLAYIQESKHNDEVAKFLIYKKAEVDQSVIKALEKKGIFQIVKRSVDRIHIPKNLKIDSKPLTAVQLKVLTSINEMFDSNNRVLLHGITGSGKTKVYIEKIKQTIGEGGQALYLVPEIALTTQMLKRVRSEFDIEIGFYHSRMNIHERVELWQKVKDGLPVVIGARSSLFLPFDQLKLIIIDEEHDNSYKQQDPNPRYNARDAAMYLAQLFKAQVLLGTATPSLESLHNSHSGKYGYVELRSRYGNALLPDIEIVDLRIARQTKSMKNHFSLQLLNEIAVRLEKKEQVILFQNRRGYAPTLKCHQCGWHAECPNCDVSLTVHQYFEELRCHYCNHKTPILQTCPACGNFQLSKMGFGTEKVEVALKDLFPNAKISRMDHDAVRSKMSYEKIIHQMESGRIDILVGTQMITKGLDFDHVTLVGILNADALFMFPDFRATEKAFHLLTQVSGRAGRKEKAGKVLIQTSNPEHPVIVDVINGAFKHFADRELSERKHFSYPPYVRIISVTIKHKVKKTVAKAALKFVSELKKHLGRRVLGPTVPYIGKVRNMYIQQVMIKLENSPKTLN